ncbi:MAG: hypothetical protein DWQ07_20470 [Chloroflexi bacterium]|nr:MAG: hypothetical protein DWQ07_20470 [Chloroflexota bacterium]MBL1194458.1 hypothetical protein [Chloroflexota bacterium]NOH11745.1 hypothetical protein [Chloroflexota bacterium]
MRILEYKENEKKDAEPGPLDNILKQISGLLGGGETPEQKAREVIMPRLERVLNDDYVMMLDYPIPGLGVTIPMLLVGPPGVRVIYPSAIKGVFRAKEDMWLEMHDRKRHFEPAKQNLMELATRYGQAVAKYLESRAIESPGVEPILMFSEPSIHVDTARPNVRVVIREAIEKYGHSLTQAPGVLNGERIYSIITMITRPPQGAAAPASAKGEGKPKRARRKRRARFSRTQWIVLGALVVLLLMIVSVLGVYILINLSQVL